MRGRGLTWLDRSEDVRSAGSPGEGVCWCKLTVFGDPGGGEKLTQRFVDKRIVPIDRWGREGQLMIYQQRWRTWRVCVWPGGNSGGCLWVIPKSCGKGHFFAGSHFLEFRREGRSLTIFFFLLQNHTSQKLVKLNVLRVKAASVGTAREDQDQVRDGGRACW